MRVLAFLLAFCMCFCLYAEWQNLDVPDDGAVLAGSATEDPAGTWTLEGGGADIWGTADQFHFLYDDVMVSEDDFAIDCLVESLVQPNNHAWGKAGIMVRVGTPGMNATESYAYLAATTLNGVCFQYRDGMGAGAADPFDAGQGLRWQVPPENVNLKMVRSGNLYSGFASIDAGATWTFIGEHEFTVGLLDGIDEMYRGIAITSHDNAVLATAVVLDIDLDADPLETAMPPSNLVCTPDAGDVVISWIAEEAYDELTLTRTDMSTMVVEDLPLTEPDSYEDLGLGDGNYLYTLTATHGGVQYAPLTCSVKIGEEGTINADGYFQSWLILGPLGQGGGANPGIPAIYNDYLAGPDDTEATVLPQANDVQSVDFGLAASTSVMGPTGNGTNPDALDGEAEWVAWEDPDFRIGHDDVWGTGYDNFVAYHVCYINNTSGGDLFLNAVAASDDTSVYMLDNTVMGVAYWASWAEATFPFPIPEGWHRIMVKCFEGGGGNGIQFRLQDPATGFFITMDDGLFEYSIIKPAEFDEVPAAPIATATRVLPGTMFIGTESPVTIDVTDGPLTVMEIVPPNVEVADLGGGAMLDGIITWTDVSDSVTYTVQPTDVDVNFMGIAKDADGAVLPIGGASTTVFPVETEGWFTTDIADSGLDTTDAIITTMGDTWDMEVIGSGHDIWDAADDFRFVWKEFAADDVVVMQARLESFPRNNNDWAKAGIMFRQNLTQGSPFVFGAFRCGAADGLPGRCIQWRDNQDTGAGWFDNLPTQNLPYWVRVVYNAGMGTVYFALDWGNEPDEADWELHGSHELNLDGTDKVFGGIAVSSHSDTAIVTATFTDIKLAEVCKPAVVTRSFDWEERINGEGANAPVLADDGSDALPVILTISDVRANGGDCPDLGDVTIIETLPADWSAVNISDGGEFVEELNTVIWEIDANDMAEGTLTYDVVGEFVTSKALTIAGEVTEMDNDFTFDIKGDDTAVSDAGIGTDGAILRWLILGPFTHNSPAGAHDALVMVEDHLTDGVDISEESISTEEDLFQEAGDEITPDYGNAAASTGLNAATNPALNPNANAGTAMWEAYMDFDGAFVDFVNAGLYGTNNNCMGYGLCYLTVEEDMDIVFACGSDDAIQILLDGNEVWINPADRGWPGFVDLPTAVTVTEGTHVLLVKTFNGTGGWNFGVQLQDEFTFPITEGVSVSLTPPGAGPEGISVSTGDVNGDGAINLADAITLLTHLFVTKGLPCEKAGDANDDNKLDLADAISILTYQFQNGTLIAPDGTVLNSQTVGCYVYPTAEVEVSNPPIGCANPCAK